MFIIQFPYLQYHKHFPSSVAVGGKALCLHAVPSYNFYLYLLNGILRSISGYIPLDFAVVGKKKNWKLARMLDDRHLLPRAEFQRLEKCIIEVWRKKGNI